MKVLKVTMGAIFTYLPDESMYTPETLGHVIPSDVLAPINLPTLSESYIDVVHMLMHLVG